MGRLLLLVVLWSAPASAGELLLAGRVERVVVAGDLVAVVRPGEVRVLSADGRSLFRLDVDRAPSPLPHRRPDDVLDDQGIPEDERTGEYAEALVDEESTLRDRGVPAIESDSTAAPALAASATDLWIAVGQTLWRVDQDGRARRLATFGQRLDLLAAGPDGRLLAASGPRLWLSRDEGLTFDRLTEADGPVRAVAAGDGFLAWATAAQLTRVEVGRMITQPLSSPRDLRACGPRLLVLDARGLVVVGADARVLPAGREAARVACGGGTWVLVGRRLLVSSDEGRSFAARGDLPPAVTLDAAVGPRGLLVATEAGLHGLPAQEGPPGPAPRKIVLGLPPPGWAPYLPRLTLAARADFTAGRDELRALAYADFPLAPPRPPLPVRLAEVEPAEPVPPPISWRPDREAPCLAVARGEAVARALVEPERARSYVSRAGHAAWLPELRLLMNRRLGRSESLDVPSGGSVGPGPLGLDTANDVRYEARATWDLSKLVFSAEEIAAVTAALRMADLRREVESLANRLYFERRRLKMEPVPTADTRARRELRVEELDAELDALSGGAFTRCLSAPP